jgi:hypothetical protein
MAMAAGRNAGQSYSEINMTPLIDVMHRLRWDAVVEQDGSRPRDDAELHYRGSQQITATGSAYHGGQVRKLPNCGANPSRFAATRSAKNRLRQ